MEIREAIESDAQKMIDLFARLDNETSFMMMESGERKISVEDQKKSISSFARSSNKLMAVALIEDQIIGFLVTTSGAANRNRHSA